MTADVSDTAPGDTSARLGPAERAASFERLGRETFDVVVIGGGVVGAGAALDAVTRGLSVALVEARDLASGTSSRSSKLFHGGLRYLEMFEFGLVREALRERELMLTKICPHLAKPVSFLYPLSKPVIERPYVAAGLIMYDSMGGARSVPGHKHLTRAAALRLVPGLRRDALVGGIRYYDGQVDDARHTMTVARTAAAYGAVVRTSTQVVVVPQGVRPGGRRPGPGRGDRRGDRRQGQGGDQLDRGVDRRTAATVRWPRPVPGARVQGRAPGGATGPDHLGERDHPQDREIGAVRHPVEVALDHRDHRHRLESRPRAPRRDQGRHRLHPRPCQQGAGRAADPRRHRGGLRGPAAVAGRGERAVVEAVPGTCGGQGRARPDRDRRREVHDLPGDGRGRRRGLPPRTCPAGSTRPAPRTCRWSARWVTRRWSTRPIGWPPSTACIPTGSGTCWTGTARRSTSCWPRPQPIPSLLQPIPGARRLPAGRGAVRGDPRGRAASGGRAGPADQDLHRVRAPRHRVDAAGSPRSWRRCSAGRTPQTAREVEVYQARVDAERRSQTEPDDSSAEKVRLEAPEVRDLITSPVA